jgi:uncharacterized protein
MRHILIVIACLFALISGQQAYAQSFPALSGRVVDEANLLDAAQEEALTAKLQNLEQTTSRQFVVVTLNDLKGYDIADYGYRLGRHWAIGQKEIDNGLLLIVAPNQRKVRFEVGYGLEPVMTDAMSHYIIQESIIPKFKEKDFAGGIDAGVDRAIAQINMPPEQAEKAAIEAAKKQRSRNKSEPDIGTIIFWIFIFFFFIMPMVRGLFGKRGRRYAKDGYDGPIIIWGGGSDWGGSSGSSGWDSGSFGGFSGGGGGFGGGGASGDW